MHFVSHQDRKHITAYVPAIVDTLGGNPAPNTPFLLGGVRCRNHTVAIGLIRSLAALAQWRIDNPKNMSLFLTNFLGLLTNSRSGSERHILMGTPSGNGSRKSNRRYFPAASSRTTPTALIACEAPINAATTQRFSHGADPRQGARNASR